MDNSQYNNRFIRRRELKLEDDGKDSIYFGDPKDHHPEYLYQADLQYKDTRMGITMGSKIEAKCLIIDKFRRLFKSREGHEPTDEDIKEAEDNIIYFIYKFDTSYYGKENPE
jgi:hypothetical protein